MILNVFNSIQKLIYVVVRAGDLQIVRPEQDDGSDMKVADKEFSPRDIGNVIVLVAALGSLVWYQYPLKSSRPDATELEKNMSQHDHGARARLWRDPFAAVEDYRRKFNIQHEQEPLGHWWPDLIDQGKKHVGKELILLPVLVNGAPEQEEVENRIRTRVAVVSALGIAGYEPLDGDHIGYVLKPYKHSEYMPFEWYVRSEANGPGSSALVLWINDDGIDSPLVPIAESYEQLKPLFAKIYSDVSTITKVIGPSSSNGLRAIVEAVSKPRPNREIDILNGLEIFSARATADDALLLLHQGENDLQKWVKKRADIDLYRIVGSDQQLVKELIDELTRRGVNAAHDSIVLVSEWDTFYGRTLPLTFAAESQGIPLASFARRVKEMGGMKNVARNIHPFTYLKGLDGEVPEVNVKDSDRSNKSSDDSTESKRNEPRKNLDYFERPTGRSQLDYVRRLASSIERLDGETTTRIKAVGVLGSDIYDKLLILQSLQRKFPHVLFFTTDLDARLFDPKEINWTRNLLVASHFGLEAHPDIQNGQPPFRDSYQTSIFLAVLQAVRYLESHGTEYKIANSGKTTYRNMRPRLYEIGLSGPVDLSVDQPKGLCLFGDHADSSLPDTASMHSSRPSIYPDVQRFLSTLALLAIAVGLLIRITQIREVLDRYGNLLKGRYAVPIAIVVIVLSVIGIAIFREHDEGEPFLLTAGVSVWPGEMLRLLVVALCAYFIMRAWLDLEDLQRDRSKSSDSPGGMAPWKWQGSWTSFKNIYWHDKDVPSGHEAKTFEELWSDYIADGSIERRLIRAALMAVGFFILAGCLMFIFGRPFVPYRGSVTSWLDPIVTLFMSVPALLLLQFFVLDATVLFSRFIADLSGVAGGWPADMMKPVSELGIPADRLKGWFKIRLVGEQTTVIAKLVYYPFIVLALMIAARNRYFDNWDFPVALIVVWSLSAGIVAGCALHLRSVAERLRQRVLHDLRSTLSTMIGQGYQATAVQVTQLIEDIQSMRDGAFASYLQQPAVAATLLAVFAAVQYFVAL